MSWRTFVAVAVPDVVRQTRTVPLVVDQAATDGAGRMVEAHGAEYSVQVAIDVAVPDADAVRLVASGCYRYTFRSSRTCLALLALVPAPQGDHLWYRLKKQPFGMEFVAMRGNP